MRKVGLGVAERSAAVGSGWATIAARGTTWGAFPALAAWMQESALASRTRPPRALGKARLIANVFAEVLSVMNTVALKTCRSGAPALVSW